MKKVLFSQKFQKIVSDVCLYAIIISVILFFTIRNRSKELGISPESAYYLIIPVVPMIVYCYFYFASKLPVSRYYFFGEITNISHKGFAIGNILDDSSRKIIWDEVAEVKFDAHKDYLEIYFKRGNIIQIRKEVDHFYRLIEQIPRDFAAFDFNYVKEMFRRATTCSCCGHVAFVQGNCAQCSYILWDKEVYDEYPNADTYLKAEQLSYFSTLEKGDPVEFFPKEPHDYFKFDRHWKPSVTEEEVLGYSRENEWD